MTITLPATLRATVNQYISADVLWVQDTTHAVHVQDYALRRFAGLQSPFCGDYNPLFAVGQLHVNGPDNCTVQNHTQLCSKGTIRRNK